MATLRVLAGASGYSYKPWKGPFYPADLPDKDMLAFYASRLPAVEINNTFYRMPKASVLSDWAEKTPDGFRFVLKASRKITHIHRLKDVGDMLDYLLKSASALENKLGPLLFQLPPYLKKDRERLETFLALLPEDCQAALEFRNPSWFDDEILDVLRNHRAALCISETGDDEDGVPFVATAGWGYLRLRRDDYTDTNLENWAERLRTQPWSEVYVFFKHEDQGAAPKLAERLMTLANR